MKRAMFVLPGIVFLLIGCQPQHDDPAAVRRTISEKNQKFIEAVKSGDIDGAMANYWKSPNLVLMMPEGDVVKGYDAARNTMQAMMQETETLDMQLLEGEIDVSGNMASDWGRWRWVMRVPSGEEMTVDGRYTTVWAKKEGDWVIVVDHASIPMPEQQAGGSMEATKK